MMKEEYEANRMAAVREGRTTYIGTPCKRGHDPCTRNLNSECMQCKALRDDGRTPYYKARDAVRSANVEYRAMRAGSTVPTRPIPTHCEWCGDPPRQGRSLCLDHCHRTGRFRAWLCDDCNHGIGKFKDDPKLLRNVADKIEAFNKEVICVDSY